MLIIPPGIFYCSEECTLFKKNLPLLVIYVHLTATVLSIGGVLT
jgi:hypothetical protein